MFGNKNNKRGFHPARRRTTYTARARMHLRSSDRPHYTRTPACVSYPLSRMCVTSSRVPYINRRKRLPARAKGRKGVKEEGYNRRARRRTVRVPVVTSRYNNCVLVGSTAARPRNFKTVLRVGGHGFWLTHHPAARRLIRRNTLRALAFLSGPSISRTHTRTHRCPPLE